MKPSRVERTAGQVPEGKGEPSPVLGIDLGTTYSLVAHLDRLGRPTSIPNSDGELLTPSVVLFDADGPVVVRCRAR
jgi:molecular chaperone DnaK